MKCCICQKSTDEVGALYRVNEKGVPGIWACAKHVKQTDAKVDPEVADIVSVISGQRRAG